jgi:hypothetical protein
MEYISIVSSQSVTFIVTTLGAKYTNVYFGFIVITLWAKYTMRILGLICNGYFMHFFTLSQHWNFLCLCKLKQILLCKSNFRIYFHRKIGH